MQRTAMSWQIRVSIWCFAIGTLLILWTLARISVQQSGTVSAPAPQQIAIVPTAEPTITPQPTATPEPTATELPTATPEPMPGTGLGITVEQFTQPYIDIGFEFKETESNGMKNWAADNKLGLLGIYAKDGYVHEVAIAVVPGRENAQQQAALLNSAPALIFPDWNAAAWIGDAWGRLEGEGEVQTQVSGQTVTLKMTSFRNLSVVMLTIGNVSNTFDPLKALDQTPEQGVLGLARRDMLGESWPLTVGEITLHCIDHAIIGGVNGVMYAINGTAKSRAEAHGWRDIDEIWADDDGGLKKDLSVLITMGEQHCVKE